MTVPHKLYMLRPRISLLGATYSGGSLTEHQVESMPNYLSLDAGLDQMVRAEIAYVVSPWARNIDPELDHSHLLFGIMPNLSDSWNLPEIDAGERLDGIAYLTSWEGGVGTWLNSRQDSLIANGLKCEMVNYDPWAPNQNGEYVHYYGRMFSIVIFYFNPIVNDISRFWAPPAGGVEVVLTGLGFNNLDSELDTGGPSRGNWNDKVDQIDFVGLQGQGTTSITEGAGDFTVDSNSQITIPANKFPALSAGTYHINLKKLNVALDNPTHITGYAGDWACDSAGRIRSSTRIAFFISDTYADRPFRTRQAPLILTDWHLKDRSDGTEVMKYYAMDTIRCPDRVYEGNLSAMSPIPRGFDLKTGLFKVSDMTLDLANNKLEFSKLMAGSTILKNKIVKVYQAYPDEPFGWRTHIISLIIDDYSFEDEVFKVKLKDITQKYFRATVPREICTEDEYANIHPDSIGAYIPEVLGLCSLTGAEFRGQVEAICIDTTTYKYVAANGALYSIDQVYSESKQAMSTDLYSVTVEDDGRTYITFTEDQEDNKVTFNCKGYSLSGMNSDNGYVQNPAYIFLYFLLVILEVPPTLIDIASFIRAVAVFDNMGEDEAAKLILQNGKNPMDITQDLMAGAKCYLRKDGRLALGKKDVSNWNTNEGQTAPIIFRQLDIVGKFERQYNMRDAINRINAEYDWIETWKFFKSNETQRGDIIIDPWDPVEVPIDLMVGSGTVKESAGDRGK